MLKSIKPKAIAAQTNATVRLELSPIGFASSNFTIILQAQKVMAPLEVAGRIEVRFLFPALVRKADGDHGL